MNTRILLTTVGVIALLLNFSNKLVAKQITVSNNPNRPAMYSNLQLAIDSASANDTILISASLTSYGTASISKPGLHIRGAGFYSADDMTTKVDVIYLYDGSAGNSAKNTKISGIDIQTYLYIYSGYNGSTENTGGITGVLIERCKIKYLHFANNSYSGFNEKNDTIRNCVFQNGYISWTFYYNTFRYNNIHIHNNIFSYSYLHCYYGSASSDMDSIFITHNNFVNNYSYSFYQVYGMKIENNIFHNSVVSGAYNTSFVNNLVYGATDSLPGVANYGFGNKNNTNPLFNGYTSGNWTPTSDFSLQSSSPAKNAATNNTDIGITGGPLPFTKPTAPTRIPIVTEITFPNGHVKPTGSTLNVQFKARIQE